MINASSSWLHLRQHVREFTFPAATPRLVSHCITMLLRKTSMTLQYPKFERSQLPGDEEHVLQTDWTPGLSNLTKLSGASCAQPSNTPVTCPGSCPSGTPGDSGNNPSTPRDLRAEFSSIVRSRAFPCVGAKAALAQGQIDSAVYGDIDQANSDLAIRHDLQAFIDTLDPESPVMQSFAAIFNGPELLSEHNFEKALWNRLQSLHNLDAVTGQPWDPSASKDPQSPHFAVSLCGTAFFVIGLHPNASRPARRFPFPALIFNSHAQFERLRAEGRFEPMRTIIRRNELQTSGSINPMLNDFGETSEARQYSGREVDDGWNCPFEAKQAS